MQLIILVGSLRYSILTDAIKILASFCHTNPTLSRSHATIMCDIRGSHSGVDKWSWKIASCTTWKSRQHGLPNRRQIFNQSTRCNIPEDLNLQTHRAFCYVRYSVMLCRKTSSLRTSRLLKSNKRGCICNSSTKVKKKNPLTWHIQYNTGWPQKILLHGTFNIIQGDHKKSSYMAHSI
jgi:hypothetical protein